MSSSTKGVTKTVKGHIVLFFKVFQKKQTGRQAQLLPTHFLKDFKYGV